MAWTHARAVGTGRITFTSGTASALLLSGSRVAGAQLADGSRLAADLVVVAAGAWTPSLVDLSGLAVATGQVLGYLRISAEEQERLGRSPVLLDLTDGLFVIPPRDGVLKVARHSYGYLNPVSLPRAPLGKTTPESPRRVVSVPLTHLSPPSPSSPNDAIPPEGEAALRAGLRKLVPSLGDRPFFKTRLCWYTDTPTGDWIIDYHPRWEGLFVATGGSGHGFKFLPVLGDKIVDCIVGNPPEEFREKWKFRTVADDDDVERIIATEDGSRGGCPGLVLAEEWKQSKL
ncbi:FAD dependent oxidoreductase-domain-containing protein [Camillea tinctor]|nr:FAD dependent oxidoreductase-domain-containing protein [Camillea tinctor]